MSLRRYAGQAFAYAAFVILIGVLSRTPSYQHLAPDLATIKLSLRHAGQLIGECRERSVAEMADLPPNMRAPMVCPRERSALTLELDIDGESAYAETLPPRGLHGDGRVSIYRRLSVPAGKVRVDIRLKDDVNLEGFQYQTSRSVDLAPAETLVIDFDEHNERFELSQR